MIVCHDSTTVIPALVARGLSAVPMCFDFSETPNLNERTTSDFRRMTKTGRWYLEMYDRWLGRRASVVTTSSRSFAAIAEKRYQRPVYQVINYVKPNLPTTDFSIRDKIGATQDDLLIVWPSVFSRLTGAIFALETMLDAPKNWRLVILDSESNADPDLAILLSQTAARFDFVSDLDYHSYVKIISECDVGWVLFSDEWENLRLCLPNRCLDILSAGIPMISTCNESIENLLAGQMWGKCIANHDRLALLKETKVVAGKRYEPPNMRDLGEKLNAVTFRSVFTRFAPTLIKNDRRPLVLIVAMRSLQNRKRIVLMAKAFVDMGWRVKIICQINGPQLSDLEDEHNWSRHVIIHASMRQS